jgi:hypothetical protein
MAAGSTAVDYPAVEIVRRRSGPRSEAQALSGRISPMQDEIDIEDTERLVHTERARMAASARSP